MNIGILNVLNSIGTVFPAARVAGVLCKTIIWTSPINFDTRQNYRICYISNPDALYNLKLCILQKYSNLIGSISEIPKVSIVIPECWVILPCIDQMCITHIYIASSYNILPTQHHEGNQYFIVVRRQIIPLFGVYCNILTYFQALKYIVYDTKWRVMGER